MLLTRIPQILFLRIHPQSTLRPHQLCNLKFQSTTTFPIPNHWLILLVPIFSTPSPLLKMLLKLQTLLLLLPIIMTDTATVPPLMLTTILPGLMQSFTQSYDQWTRTLQTLILIALTNHAGTNLLMTRFYLSLQDTDHPQLHVDHLIALNILLPFVDPLPDAVLLFLLDVELLHIIRPHVALHPDVDDLPLEVLISIRQVHFQTISVFDAIIVAPGFTWSEPVLIITNGTVTSHLTHNYAFII